MSNKVISDIEEIEVLKEQMEKYLSELKSKNKNEAKKIARNSLQKIGIINAQGKISNNYKANR